jgi:hypothetical protein
MSRRSNFALLQLCRLCQATFGSSFCKNPFDIDYNPKKFFKKFEE